MTKIQLILLLVLAIGFSVSTSSSAAGSGDPKPIADPSSPEVQRLGKFAIVEYNTEQGASKLSYVAVVSGETLAISTGVDYILRISATDTAGASRLCEALVWSNPAAFSTQLVAFRILN